ncbi:hypothetical protein PanWU01x14_132730 [Parasponia andersonii]|uniref:Uncharacterized protein n=1 Tax=Parasponia andersonii TaxID=3476 RepID=A0A2P5CQ42_PARAD|nr:hypothetical protein PanWU01x14_132730 [Parasponia andersonii]
MDDLVLENICDRVKSLIFTKGETPKNPASRYCPLCHLGQTRPPQLMVFNASDRERYPHPYKECFVPLSSRRGISQSPLKGSASPLTIDSETGSDTIYNERGRPSSESVVRGKRAPPEQPSPPRRPQELLHARPRQLQRRRAPVVVSPPTLHQKLPPSSSTLVTLETTEAFGLEAEDVKYVTQHFRYTFVNEKVKRSARYYSPGWRTWAAVAIQLAWRRYKHRLTLTSLSFVRPRKPLSRCSSLGEDRLRLYTALLTSPKPNQDDFDC